MAKIIAICGKICSGKSYYADKIKDKENAVILSTDEVTFDLFDNQQGENYNQLASRVNSYLMKKSVELVKVGCNIILDWGFWTSKIREEVSNYYKSHDIQCEWHYIDIDDTTWYKNIDERNKKVLLGDGGSNFYVDDGLLKKVLSQFEVPSRNQIDVWYKNDRVI